jgi:hypothetical protein
MQQNILCGRENSVLCVIYLFILNLFEVVPPMFDQCMLGVPRGHVAADGPRQTSIYAYYMLGYTMNAPVVMQILVSRSFDQNAMCCVY